MYNNGEGVPQDDAEAVTLFTEKLCGFCEVG
jgi:hypothetical protein